MSNKTKIQWCDSTVNPTMGCDGCELWSAHRETCYAGVLHTRFGGSTPGYAPKFEQVTLFPGRMAEAARWSDLTGKSRPQKPWLDAMPRLVFVSDMSDALSESVPFEYLESEVIAAVTSELGQRHQWPWLTKRPERMAKFSRWLLERGQPWPSNLWTGTSVTDQKTASRIRSLLKVGDENTIRFLSVEPQFEEINIERWLPRLDWIIGGGESGRKARPFDMAWADEMIRQCRRHKVSKGKPQTFQDSQAGDWEEWQMSLRVRNFRWPFESECKAMAAINSDGKGIGQS